MAKRRKKRTVTNKRKQQDTYVHAIVIMIFSILLAVLIYIKSLFSDSTLSILFSRKLEFAPLVKLNLQNLIFLFSFIGIDPR